MAPLHELLRQQPKPNLVNLAILEGTLAGASVFDAPNRFDGATRAVCRRAGKLLGVA
jgi:hypothetical protein